MSTRSRLYKAAIASCLLPHVVHVPGDSEPTQSPLHRSHGGTSGPQHVKFLDQDTSFYTLGGVTYVSLLTHPVATVPFTSSPDNQEGGSMPPLFPLTVVNCDDDGAGLAPDALLRTIKSYDKKDDVFNPAWLNTVLFVSPEGTKDSESLVDHGVHALLSKEYGTEAVYHDSAPSTPIESPERDVQLPLEALRLTDPSTANLRGPYLGRLNPDNKSLSLFPVYRLYSDTQRAFLFGMLPDNPAAIDSERTYSTLRHLDDKGYLQIPVPSRLQHERGEDGIKGVRIAVKDIYDVKGVPTGAGSRAYGELYGPVTKSADSIKDLDEPGGIFVGKTKTAMFADGKDAHDITIDEQYPFLERGDGWQSASGSSHGSACAMAAYDWLDVGLGSDTFGSVRGPAAFAGLYGNRPSVPVKYGAGKVVGSDLHDTLGALTRDPKVLNQFLKSWYQNSPLNLTEYPKYPQELLIDAAYIEQAVPKAQSLVDEFAKTLTEKAGMEIVPIDLTAKLVERYGSIDKVKEYFSLAGPAFDWSAWHSTGKPFADDYAAANDGRFPPLDWNVRKDWKLGRDNYTEEMHELAKHRGEEFSKWFNDEVLKEDPESCSGSILMYDIGPGGSPVYREHALGDEFQRDTPVLGGHFCPVAGCVDITVPIGQVGYESLISQKEEQKAVTVSLIARRGCDYMLQDFVETLAKKGILQTVKTGRTAF